MGSPLQCSPFCPELRSPWLLRSLLSKPGLPLPLHRLLPLPGLFFCQRPSLSNLCLNVPVYKGPG